MFQTTFVDEKKYHQFRKFNNAFERKQRQLNMIKITENTPKNQIPHIIRENERRLMNETLSQMMRYPDYFSSDIDVHSLNTINSPSNSAVSLYVKPTHYCNLNCTYCYDTPNRKPLDAPGNKMSLETIRKIIDVFKDSGIQSWIWHGGEPLTMGVEFLTQANALLKRAYPQVRIGMQSNGTLITDEVIAMFKNDKFSTGISFDGLNNDLTRKSTARVMESFNLLEANGFRISPLQVVDNGNVSIMIEDYEYAKRLNLIPKINIIHSAAANANAYDLEGERTAEELIKFFGYWIKDTYSPAPAEYPSRYIQLLLHGGGGDREVDCAKDKNRFSIDPDGTIYHCASDFPEKLAFGNIWDVNSQDDIINTPVYQKWFNDTRKLLDICKPCQFYYACQSSCFAVTATQCPDFDHPEPNYCAMKQRANAYFLNTLFELNPKDYATYNYHFVNLLYRYGFRSFSLIENAVHQLSKWKEKNRIELNK